MDVQRPAGIGVADQLRLTRRQLLGASAASAGLGLFGCSPVAPTAPPVGGDQSAASAASSRSAQATVHLGANGIIPTFADIEQMGTSRTELWGIGHSALAQFDHDGNLIPMLAERLPSVEDGSWVVSSDGTMQMTWHLRPGVNWHDGHPFTSRDLRFSWEFSNDSSLPLTRRPINSNVTAIDLPDDHTAVMHWKVAN